jgi:hypothetical protein
VVEVVTTLFLQLRAVLEAGAGAVEVPLRVRLAQVVKVLLAVMEYHQAHLKVLAVVGLVLLV